MSPTRILIAFLNTGGGHRSAALAVAEALRDLYGRAVQVTLVDVTTERFTWPLSQLDAMYDGLVRLRGWPWALTYHLSNGPHRMAVLSTVWWLLTKEPIQGLMSDCPSDVVVCCHPLLKAPLARALPSGAQRTPLITLVTDLASAHAAWFYPEGGKCLVPTERVRRQALACGLPPRTVDVTGLPVRPHFLRATEQDPTAARSALGLDPGRPVVLLVGGADGMGPFCSLLRTLVSHDLPAQLVAITGRNERLHTKLAAHTWAETVHLKGYVENMHEWMCAADLLITKAGPATIAEALVTGTPIVLSGAVPGQEPANVAYVREIGAGIWASNPDQAAEAVQQLLTTGGEKLEWMTQQARLAARPDAAWRVAEVVWRYAAHASAA